VQLFYYGTQDVPVPPRRARPSPFRSRSFLCESCRSAVTGEEIERGTASEVFGLVLCGQCRHRFEGDDRVELYFCGECGVSVPLFRVETGEAVEGDGRILCLPCRAARRRPRRWRVATLLAAGFLAFAWALRPPPPGPPVGPGSARLIEELLPTIPEGAIPRERMAWIESRIAELSAACSGLEQLRGRVLAAVEEANVGFLLGQEDFHGRADELEGLLLELTRRLEELESASKGLNLSAEDSR
jgi:hypothetical protein